MKTNLWAMPLQEMENVLSGAGYPRYRARQISDYLYKRKIYAFDEMLQIPLPLRKWLNENCCADRPKIEKEQWSTDRNTCKILLELSDGSLIETVCMHHNYGNSVCVSTQVGCAMGCVFCASTQKGCLRGLSAAEMLSQVYAFRERGISSIHSIVLMGSGEPLMNYEEVLRFIRLCHEEDMCAVSYRNITLSTVGIIPQIRRLAKEELPITLAISLHAPNDSIRRRILPVSARYPMEELLSAAGEYFKETGRRVTFEYILIHGINDSRENAEELGQRLRHLNCHINLIPINGNEHIRLEPPSAGEVKRFHDILVKYGKSVTVRRQMGDEISAACGQLKRRYETDGVN